MTKARFAGAISVLLLGWVAMMSIIAFMALKGSTSMLPF